LSLFFRVKVSCVAGWLWAPLAEHGKEPVGRLDVLGQGRGGRAVG